jgi:hypothetical protein
MRCKTAAPNLIIGANIRLIIKRTKKGAASNAAPYFLAKLQI